MEQGTTLTAATARRRRRRICHSKRRGWSQLRRTALPQASTEFASIARAAWILASIKGTLGQVVLQAPWVEKRRRPLLSVLLLLLLLPLLPLRPRCCGHA